MPVVFRCFYCRGKLSIARRKAGQDVECPRCQAIITVPTPDDLGRELTQLLSSADHRPVAAAPAGHARAAATVPPPAYHFDDPAFDLPAPPPPRPAPRPAPKPAREPSDPPLFEADGIEQLLAQKIGPERPPEPRPAPAPVAADLPAAISDDAFVVSRAKATLLLIGAVLATGLAFAAGFYVRGLS